MEATYQLGETNIISLNITEANSLLVRPLGVNNHGNHILHNSIVTSA
jgi:hypothetical protein